MQNQNNIKKAKDTDQYHLVMIITKNSTDIIIIQKNIKSVLNLTKIKNKRLLEFINKIRKNIKLIITTTKNNNNTKIITSRLKYNTTINHHLNHNLMV